MRPRAPLAALAGLLLLTASAFGQLKDDQFKVAGAKASDFGEKAMFATPPAAAFAAPAPVVGPDSGKPPPPPWGGSVEFGLSGSEGNTDVLKVRLGGTAKRQTAANIFTTDLLYSMARGAGVITEDKALFNVRDEVLFRDSPWGLFASSQLEYDKFRAYDFRVASHAGFGYQLLRSDWTNLRGRLGAGFSREVGGPNDRYVPEGLAGFDLYQKVTARQNFLLFSDIYPDLGRLGEYRLRVRAAYEFLLEPDWGLKLRLGAQDRYDSNPGPAKRNDVDYFATLLFKF